MTADIPVRHTPAPFTERSILRMSKATHHLLLHAASRMLKFCPAARRQHVNAVKYLLQLLRKPGPPSRNEFCSIALK
jgi:hypothetical protein